VGCGLKKVGLGIIGAYLFLSGLIGLLDEEKEEKEEPLLHA